MPTYSFTLIVAGADLQTDAAQDALFEAGCDDATFGVSAGVQHAAFDREAPSFFEALRSAIAAVETAVPGARMIRVEPDELVTMSEIADRVGRTRESIRLLVAGERGPGGFPAPASRPTARNPLWRWPQVARWLNEQLGVHIQSDIPWHLVVAVNAAFELRRQLPELTDDERGLVEHLRSA
ncbi:MAG: helix-turn-helix transcriptional regulator [Egibacteraceae bacterium]